MEKIELAQSSRHPEHTPEWWKWFKDFYLVYLPLRFNVILIGILAFLFLQFPQGHDIVSRMAGQTDPGAAIAFDVFVFILALQVWFWSRQLLYLVPKNPPASRFPLLTRWIPRVLGICVFGIALGALVRVNYGGGAQAFWRIAVRIGVLVGLLVLFLVFVIGRRLAMKTPADESKSSVGELSSQAKSIFVLSVVFFIVFLPLSYLTKTMASITSAVIVFGVSALWVAIGAVTVYLGHRWGMPLMTFAMVVTVVLSPWVDNHVIDTLQPPAGFQRQSPADTFDKWMASHDSGTGPKYPVFIVVTEGGGIRAAYWTAAVLAQLHKDTQGAFTQHTFAISGVSGGSLGALVFDTMLATGATNLPVRKILGYDALAPTLASAMGPDLLQRVIPFPVLRDRARALELGWEQGWRGSDTPDHEAMTKGFLEMFAKHGAEIPSLFLNGTVVETGERIVTSNCHIDWIDAFDGIDELGGDLKLSTAATMSGRFPYISPAGTIIKSAGGKANSQLQCDTGARCAHVVDGGYFESSAAATAIQLMLSLQSAKKWNRVIPYVVIIRYVDPGTKASSIRLAPEVTVPPRTAISTLGARAEFSVNRLNALGATASFVLAPTTPALPLGWLLSDHSMDWMQSQIETGANRRCAATIRGLIDGTIHPASDHAEVCAGQPPPSPMTR